MTGDTDLVALRRLVESVVVPGLMGFTHAMLGEACERLGLPEPSGEGEGTKRERVNTSFAALSDADLPMVAERVLMGELPLDAAARNAIQDVLWAGRGAYEIPKRTRHEIARDLDLADLVYDADRFTALLNRLWVLDDDPFAWLTQALLDGPATGLRGQILRRVTVRRSTSVSSQ